MRLLKLLVFSLFSFSPLVHASYTCEGQVQGLSIDPKSGAVLAEKVGPLVWPKLCSITHTANNVSPESCKVIYSSLLSAQMANKEVKLWFNDGKDCSRDSHVPWQNLTGWYFGPMIK